MELIAVGIIAISYVAVAIGTWKLTKDNIEARESAVQREIVTAYQQQIWAIKHPGEKPEPPIVLQDDEEDDTISEAYQEYLRYVAAQEELDAAQAIMDQVHAVQFEEPEPVEEK